MKIEEMETIITQYIKKRSAKIGQPILQDIYLVNEDTGLKVNDERIEVSINMILEGINLEDLVDRIISLDWELLHKAREEKRRVIEKNKFLATCHIHELERLCTIEEFNSFLLSFKKGLLTCCPKKGD
jgi:hypothetical protein